MDKEKNQQEYNDLVREKRTTQSQYNACESRIENCDYLLRRLRSVKEVITQEKRNFAAVITKDNRTVKEKYDFKGSNYDSFISKSSSMQLENTSYHKDSIDYVLDSLNNEITRIENQRLDEYGLLGKLGSALNSLANKIENFFN